MTRTDEIRAIVEQLVSKRLKQRQDAVAPKALRDMLSPTCPHDFDCYSVCRLCGAAREEVFFGSHRTN